MSIKRKLRALFLCLPLLFGAAFGMPLSPEEIEKLVHDTNRQKIVCILQEKNQPPGPD